jgi:pimeloyl-ACP methyl ester carboxylesterase
MARRMCGLIPDVRLLEVPDAYHHVTLDQPERFVDAVKGFI